MFSPIIEAYTEHNEDEHDTDVIATFNEFKGESAIISRPTKLQIDKLIKEYNNATSGEARATSMGDIVAYKTSQKDKSNYKEVVKYIKTQLLDNQVAQYNKLRDATAAPHSAATAVPLSTDNPKMLHHGTPISSMTFNEIVSGYSKWLAEFMDKIMKIDHEDTYSNNWYKYISTFIKAINNEVMPSDKPNTNSTIYGGVTFVLVSMFIYFVFISS